MRYGLYIYGTTAACPGAEALAECNRAVTGRVRDMDMDFLRRFDVQGVAEKIRVLAGDRCSVEITAPPQSPKGTQFLRIMTTYEQAASVLPLLHAVAADQDLALYDAETKRTFFRELLHRPFIRGRLRAEALLRGIQAQMKPLWSIRRISSQMTDRDFQRDYVVTLKKDPKRPFLTRCEAFRTCLASLLEDGETLYTDYQCFTVAGERYALSFCLEGYKRHADQMGYYEDDKHPRMKLIRRMGVDKAFRWIRRSGADEERILGRMHISEMRCAYPNPADRFAASVNISKWEMRQGDMLYAAVGMDDEGLVISVVAESWAMDPRSCSALSFRGDAMRPVLRVLERHVPCLGVRFNEDNHIPAELLQEIIDDAKAQKDVPEAFIRWAEAHKDGGGMINIWVNPCTSVDDNDDWRGDMYDWPDYYCMDEDPPVE